MDITIKAYNKVGKINPTNSTKYRVDLTDFVV